MDFKNYKKTYQAKEENEHPAKEDLRKTAEAYGKKSDDELLKDILTMANRGKADGTFTDQSLTNFANTLSPMLNEEQKERLKTVMALLKNN